jgi:eukaryotic-like serine/threonine-protein kinase
LAREPLLDSDPRRVGRYRLSARLGSGGMGVVYLGAAEDGPPVAVKVLRAQLAEDREFRTRFGREVAALVRVEGVCTVRVIEADTTAARPFLVTEYADGPSLAEYIGAHGALAAPMLYGLATGLAEALTAIHAAGIVHRDLKPSNVLLTGTGPKVIDFGIAQAQDATSLTRPGVTIGSTGFQAPEQITAGRSGTPADIFAWGVTIVYAASGQPPFGTGTPESIMFRILHAQPDLISVPAEVRPLVAVTLAKEPGNRPTARELLDSLTKTSSQPVHATQTILAQTWLAPGPGPATPAPRPPAAQAPSAARTPAAQRAPAHEGPAKTGPVDSAFEPTAETPVPAAFQATQPPRSAQNRSAQNRPAPNWPAQPSPSSRPPKRGGRRRTVIVALILALVVAAAGTGIGIALAGHHIKPNGGSTGSPTASTPAATHTASSTTAPATLPVLVAGDYHGIKPKEIDFSADAGNIVTGITWSSWTAAKAIGSGTSDIDTCIPSCAAAPTDLVTTMLVLSQPVDGHFTVISELRNGTTQAFVYPNAWALNAS